MSSYIETNGDGFFVFVVFECTHGRLKTGGTFICRLDGLALIEENIELVLHIVKLLALLRIIVCVPAVLLGAKEVVILIQVLSRHRIVSL